jgi:hypothetical protein
MTDVAKWLAAQREAEAAMTAGPWETYRPWPEMTYERIGTRKDHGVMPLRSVNAHGDLDVGNVRGIVRARNDWRKVLDVVEAAGALQAFLDDGMQMYGAYARPDVIEARRKFAAALAALVSK